MSAKSTKQTKKLSIPRTMPEVQTEYSQLCARAGQLQYQLSIQSKELQQINARLEAVNNEAAARMSLDKDAAKVEVPSAPGGGHTAEQSQSQAVS